MSSKPLITVLMPAYNAADYIAEAIESVLQQSFTRFELLIINDGSTDNTISIIAKFTDERIVLVNQSNRGVAGALNTGLHWARSNYIARFDADDICYPERLITQYNFLEQNPGYHIVGSAVDYADKDGNLIFRHTPHALSHRQIAASCLKICPFIHSGVMYRLDSILKHGGYNVHAHAFEDHLLWVNVLQHYKACNLTQSLIKVRLSPGSVTLDEKWYHPRFLEIKHQALQKGHITETEGNELLNIYRKQREGHLHHQAYYGLMAKKFLWNNHNPAQARIHLRKLLKLNRFSLKGYTLLMLSMLPKTWISKIYQTAKTS